MSIAPATRIAMVWAPRGIVDRGVTPLRAEPDDAAELVDEAQYGEVVTRLADRDGWAYVQGPDLYFGWIRAVHIVEYRTRHGQFKSVDELKQVDGLGAARFGQLKPLVTV